MTKSVLKRLRSTPGILSRKRRAGLPGTVAGDPDIYFAYRGRHVEVELKQPGNYPTFIQRTQLAAWAGAGAICRVIHSLEELDQLLEEIRRMDAAGPARPQDEAAAPGG